MWLIIDVDCEWICGTEYRVMLIQVKLTFKLGKCYDLFIFPYLILSQHLGISAPRQTMPRPDIHHDPTCRMVP